MGFRHQAKTFLLTFDDPELQGLEVRCSSLSIGELNDDDIKLFESFANHLISWNLEDENGDPIPTTLKAIEDYPDIDFVTSMANAWMNAVIGIDDELGKGSPSGEPFPEGSLPMEPLSSSLAS